MSVWLYRTEAKGIQEWILASDRLKELKGGSTIVDELPDAARKLLEGINGGTIVSAAAGGVEIQFHDEAALARFAAIWPLVVEQRAPGLALVQAWAPAAAPDSLYGDLGAQRNVARVSLPEAGPLVARSGRTGLPAVAGGGQEDGALDAAVLAKLAAARRDGSLDALAGAGCTFLEDADEIGESYLAVVHADGNGVGRIVRDIGTDRDRKRQFSEALNRATRGAAERAVRALARWQEEDRGERAPARNRTLLRARPVVLGGDDFTVIVDAAYAIPFTAVYLREFEVATAAEKDIQGGTPLTACAGIAFVKTGFPFHAANDLAVSLCDGAKRGLRPAGDASAPTPSGLLFHRITTSNSETDWATLSQGELAAPRGAISGGPYALRRLAGLEAFAIALGRWPRKALREWLGQVRVDPERAAARWHRALEVAAPPERAAFEEALTRFGHDPRTGWEATVDGNRTAVGDALLWLRLQPGLAAFPRVRS